MKLNLQSLYGWYSKVIRNPKYRWWVILGTIVYIISPFDISPDWFPIAGQIDDFLLVSVMLSEVTQMITSALKKKKEEKNTVGKTDENQSGETVDVDAVSVE